MKYDDKIWVTGHKGLVGSHILKELRERGYTNLIYATRKELDLTNEKKVRKWVKEHQPKYIFSAAALVGGIGANKDHKVEFFEVNMLIAINLLRAAKEFDVEKILLLGSSCIYPKHPKLPISEDQLLTGPLEETNDAYALAKIAQIKLAQSYHQQYGLKVLNLMPTNVYGEGDNYDEYNSHVIGAMFRKIYDAIQKSESEIELWGDGTPWREFIHAADLADACIYLMKTYDQPDLINIGTGEEVSIEGLYYMISEVSGFRGTPVWNTDMPNGTPRKNLDLTKLESLGWKSSIGLKEGLRRAWNDFIKKYDQYIAKESQLKD